MKLLVETTGAFQVLNPDTYERIRHEGLTVVTKSQFIHERASIGQLRVKGQVNDEASDDEWLETLRESDGDEELALASFLDRYPADAGRPAEKQIPAPSIPSSTHPASRGAKRGSGAPGSGPLKE